MEPIDHKKTFALLIGSTEFPYDKADTPLKPIPNIRVNIEQLQAVLTDKKIIGIPPENIIVSVNETREKIVDHLYDIINLTKESSTNLFIYYAGHGYPEYFGMEYNVYLTTYSTNTKKIEIGALRIEDFTKYIKQSNAERKFIILDACYSGEIHAIGAMGDAENQIKTELNKFKGSFVITSASKDNPSRFPIDKTNEPTYFTAEFLDVLKTGIDEKKELLSTKDIFLSIEQNLLRKKLPEPQSSNFQNADQLLFARNMAYNSIADEQLIKHKSTYRRIYKSLYHENWVISTSDLRYLMGKQKELGLDDKIIDEIQKDVVVELKKEQEIELKLHLQEELAKKAQDELINKEEEQKQNEQEELKRKENEKQKKIAEEKARKKDEVHIAENLRKEIIFSSSEPEMVFIEGGEYLMGDDNSEYDDEKPAHRVVVSDFYIGKYEITQKQWRDIMGNNSSEYNGCDNCPVEMVSWDDVQEFIERLNQKTGRNYRLPTEAEWEYAARGGNKSKGFKFAGTNYIDEVAWYKENSSNKTHPVGHKKPNELGLCDMSGNVWEWCNDWFDENYYNNSPENNPMGPSSGSYRVVRGGSRDYRAEFCRTARRNLRSPYDSDGGLGFRVVLTP